MMQIGLQLYSVRDAAAKDFIGTLKRIAEMGYEGVEFAGYGGLTPEEMKTTLTELGLQVAGSHVSIEELTNNLDAHIEMSKAVGNTFIACPWLSKESYESLEAIRATAEQFKQAAERLAAHGIQLGYHNHDFEFTTIIEGKTVEEQLFDILPAELLQCELDTCWVQFAGQDPIEWIHRFDDRLPAIHLKDLGREEDGTPITLELGKGELDLVAVANAAKQAGAKWIIVEQDQTQRDSMASVEASLRWAKTNLHGLI